MPPILNSMLKKLLHIAIILNLLISNIAFAQHSSRQQPVPAKAQEYYIYNRTANTYNGLSVSISEVTVPANKSTYLLNVIYTSVQPANKITFIAQADSSQQISLPLMAYGTKYIDDKSLTSYQYHATLTDSTLLFLHTNPLKSVLLTGENNQKLTMLAVDVPSFFSQQFNSLQKAVKSKPVRKKSVNLKPVNRTKKY
jgi:hypothetical protein